MQNFFSDSNVLNIFWRFEPRNLKKGFDIFHGYGWLGIWSTASSFEFFLDFLLDMRWKFFVFDFFLNLIISRARSSRSLSRNSAFVHILSDFVFYIDDIFHIFIFCCKGWDQKFKFGLMFADLQKFKFFNCREIDFLNWPI